MRWATGALVLAALATGAGCSDDSGVRQYDSYVALGDSFTSGAGLAETVSSDACGQSRLSYPRIVARKTGARLTDASCGAATTDNATTAQQTGAGASRPPQLDALSRDTDLVSVGLGYNNGAYFLDAMFTCSSATSVPPGSECADPAARAADIGADLAAVLDQVHERAPSADVLVVGYPQLVPESGTCPELPLAAEEDYPHVHELLRLLDDSLRQAAEDSDATFVDVYGASKGHDICAGEDAWINGITAQPGVAATYHPFARGQRGIADVVLEALGK